MLRPCGALKESHACCTNESSQPKGRFQKSLSLPFAISQGPFKRGFLSCLQCTGCPSSAPASYTCVRAERAALHPTGRAGQDHDSCHRLQAVDASAAALCCFWFVLLSAGCQLTPRRLPLAGSCQSGAAPCSLPLPVAVQVGPGDHVICALSGGVDSAVAATLVHKVLGDRLHCVFVDNGLLRYKVRRG